MNTIISNSNQIDADIKSLETRLDVKNTLAQSDEKNAELKKLQEKLKEARNIEKAAPVDRKDAEEAYYKYVYGDAYKNQMNMWYYTEANQLQTQLLQQKNGVMSQINEGLLYLSSQMVYLKQLERVAGMSSGAKTVEEVKQESTATAIRKAGFFGSSDATVVMWSNILNCIIFVYGCILLFVMRNNLTDPLVLITILATFMSVFALDFLLKLVYMIPSFFLQYIGWGYSPVEFSNWWYLWIPAVFIAIYIIISSIL
jgi:hypothetical protein